MLPWPTSFPELSISTILVSAAALSVPLFSIVKELNVTSPPTAVIEKFINGTLEPSYILLPALDDEEKVTDGCVLAKVLGTTFTYLYKVSPKRTSLALYASKVVITSIGFETPLMVTGIKFVGGASFISLLQRLPEILFVVAVIPIMSSLH